MTHVSEITSSVSLPMNGKPADASVPNFLLILMLLQSKTSEIASNNQADAAKRRRAATFTQSLVDEFKKRGGFSLETAANHNAFLDQLNKKYGSEKLSYNEELVLSQMNLMFKKMSSLESEMQKIQKEINDLKEEVKQLEKDKEHYQSELSGYVNKFKKGGFLVPGYNAYLAAKILEYKGKRDKAGDEITEKNGEINLKKQPELDALKANAQRFQKGFEGNKEAEATKMASVANDELAHAQAMLDAAMNSVNLLV